MPDQESTDGYLDIDEFTNSLDYLKKTVLFLEAFDDPFRWKWAAICMTNALYGFMISALRGLGGARQAYMVIPKKQKKELAALDKLRNPCGTDVYSQKRKLLHKHFCSGQARLIAFNEALTRIQSGKWMCNRGAFQPIHLTKDEVDAAKYLRMAMRNHFEHFVPKFWMISQRSFVVPLNRVCSIIIKVCKNIEFKMRYKESVDAVNVQLKLISILLEDNERQLGQSKPEDSVPSLHGRA